MDKVLWLYLYGGTLRLLPDNNARMKNDIRNACMVKLYSKGKGVQEIADMYNVSRQRVDQILRKVGADMRPRHTVGYVKFNCKECGTEEARKDYKNGNKRQFCSRPCAWIWRKKQSPILTVEQKRKIWRDRINAYRKTPNGYARMMASKRKFEATDRYKEWHKRYYGFYPGEGPGKVTRNEDGVCIVEGCGNNREKNGVDRKGQKRFYQTCYKHRLDGSIKPSWRHLKNNK